MTKLLIVEDEMIIARELQVSLEKLGYHVIAINTTAEEVTNTVKEMKPDVVLMDIKLNDNMDGIDIAKQIRDNYNIPSIYLTSYSDEKTLQRAMKTEPLGYILKPYTDNDLRTHIELALYKYKIELKLKRSNYRKNKLIKLITKVYKELKLKNKELAYTQKKLRKISIEINKANSKINQSIDYALRIQKSILPATKHIRNKFHQSFIYYKPKDVISGDFPWFYDKGNDIYIAAVDCTGHGVPGAMLSFIGYFLLDEIVSHTEVLKPSVVLDKLDKGVKKTLKQDEEGANQMDGMDIALCRINLTKMEVDFSGAHRPLYHLRNGKLTEYKGDRRPIGGLHYKNTDNFTNHLIKIKRGDSIFIYTDGLPDQFGGDDPEINQYSSTRIQEMIMNNQTLPLPVLALKFSGDFEKWKGSTMQYDDVLLIGIRF